MYTRTLFLWERNSYIWKIKMLAIFDTLFWHIIPGLKNTKQNLKNSKLKKKKLARFQFYRNVFKTMKNLFFFCKSIEDNMQKEVFPSKIRTQIWKYDKAVWKGKRLTIQANDFKLENDTIMKCIFVDKIQCS